MAATTALDRARYGSGLYRRGNVFWLRVRTPARLLDYNLQKGFRRFSTGCTSLPEALITARHVRVALDRGFVVVGRLTGERMLTAEQAEAILDRLARQALAEAETLRALQGRRSDAEVAVAKGRHAETALRWRSALRHNDLEEVSERVSGAAGSLGIRIGSDDLQPILLREAARLLAAVAEENIEREEGLYETDRASLHQRMVARCGTGIGRASARVVTDAGASLPPDTDLVPPAKDEAALPRASEKPAGGQNAPAARHVLEEAAKRDPATNPDQQPFPLRQTALSARVAPTRSRPPIAVPRPARSPLTNDPEPRRSASLSSKIRWISSCCGGVPARC